MIKQIKIIDKATITPVLLDAYCFIMSVINERLHKINPNKGIHFLASIFSDSLNAE